MTIAAYDSVVLGPLLSDPAINECFADASAIREMVEFERALARAQGAVGVIPAAAGVAISEALADFEPDLEAIGVKTADSGVATIALVAQLRAAVGGEAASYVHWGATSQDVIDTALVLQMRRALAHLDAGLRSLVERLAEVALAHEETVMAGRTRFQQALPTSFGLKAATWMGPLARDRARLAELRARVLKVSFGGAAGTLASLGERGLEVEERLAAELGLGVPDSIWHTQRDGIAEVAGWLSLVTGACGKMGQDVLLMAQSEVGEIRETGASGRGGSSTLPQKANPISSEVLVTLARMNAGLLANVHQAMVQEHERGGPGWQLEWLSLPQMFACAGASLAHAGMVAGQMEVRAEAMRANLEQSRGLLLAEAASFRLGEFMPRPEAQALVKDACAECMRTGVHLVDVLSARVEHPVDWEALRDPGNYLGSARALVRRAVAAARG